MRSFRALVALIGLAACGASPQHGAAPPPEPVAVASPSADAPTVRTSVRIATFNLQVFGPAKAGRPEHVAALAALMRRYDLVAVQEIRDASGQAPVALLAAVNRNDEEARYAMALSPRTGREPDDANSQEQYAYYYRTDRLRVVDDPTLFDDSAHDYFQREPYLSRFAVLESDATFVLINIHTPPRSAVPEIAAMEHVFVWAKAHFEDEDIFIALGDFNAGCGYASEEDLDALPIHGDGYDWVVPHSADTNVADSVCPYDRIVIAAPTGSDLVEEWGVDRSTEQAPLSDHFPVWVSLVF